MEAFKFLKERTGTDKKHLKNSGVALDALSQAVATMLISHSATLDKYNIVSTTDCENIISAYRSAVMTRFKGLLQKPSKYKSNDDANSMSLLSTISALEAVGFDDKKMAKRVNDVVACLDSMHKLSLDVGRELSTFMAAHTHLETPFQGLATTISGRQTVYAGTLRLIGTLGENKKLGVLNSLLEEAFDGPDTLENLLAAKDIIVSCQGIFFFHSVSSSESINWDIDSRKHTDASEAPEYDLSAAYSKLTDHMWKATSFRQFSLITEIMEIMLRTKVCHT